METTKPHVILLASPGMGHLKPMLELGKRLVNHYNLEITFFIITNETKASSASDVFKSSSSEFFHIHLVTAPPQTISESTGVHEKLALTMRACISPIRTAISEMKVSPPTAIIVDLFGTEFWDLADEFHMLKFAFMTTSALFLAALISVPFVVDKLSQKEFEALKFIDIPGCMTVAYEDVYDIANRANPVHAFARSAAANFINADGVLINSWIDLEPNTFKQLQDGRMLGTLYPIGPLTEQVIVSQNKKSLDILNWLDKQPKESVIYISFGSALSLTHQQIQEIAFGLESSRQRFIWVSRPPTDEVQEYFFVGDTQDKPKLEYLPEGFLERTKDVGVVVPMWAPQDEILAHSSVGGFLTHCGWNSTLESITNGIPFIAWPLFADQHLIANLLVDDLKIAIRPSARTSFNGPVIGREEIHELVVTLIEGEVGSLLRSRVKEIQCSGEKVIKAQKSGSSLDTLHHFAASLRSWKLGQKKRLKLMRCLSCCLKPRQP